MPRDRIYCTQTSTDRKTLRDRPCKAFALPYSPACLTHSRQKAIIIQSFWRMHCAYKLVCRIKQLPPDILSKIQFHLREEHNIKHKLIPSYISVLENRKSVIIQDLKDLDGFDRYNKISFYKKYDSQIEQLKLTAFDL